MRRRSKWAVIGWLCAALACSSSETSAIIGSAGAAGSISGAGGSQAGASPSGGSGGSMSMIGCNADPGLDVSSEWHVRTDGSDTTCDGTSNVAASAAPRCAFATIQRAIDAMTPGSAVIVHAGTYSDFTLASYSGSMVRVAGNLQTLTGSSATNPYAIIAAPGEGPVIIDGAPKTLEMAFYVRDTSHLLIRGFTIRNIGLIQGAMLTSAPILIRNGSNVTIQCNDIRDTALAGAGETYEIGLAATVSGHIVNNTIVSGQGYVLFYGTTASTPFDSVDGEIARNSIEYSGTARSLGMRPARIRHLRIQNNYLWHSSPSGHTDSYAMQLRDMESYLISGNVIEGWPNGIHNFDYSNLDEQGVIANNTLVDIAGLGVHAQRCSGCRTVNNIFAHVDTAVSCNGDNADYGASHEASHNLYHQTNKQLFLNPYTNGAGCVDLGSNVLGDPEFVAAPPKPSPYFDPSGSSPAIDAGEAAHCPWTPLDGDGDSVADCDIGAVEHL